MAIKLIITLSKNLQKSYWAFLECKEGLFIFFDKIKGPLSTQTEKPITFTCTLCIFYIVRYVCISNSSLSILKTRKILQWSQIISSKAKEIIIFGLKILPHELACQHYKKNEKRVLLLLLEPPQVSFYFTY